MSKLLVAALLTVLSLPAFAIVYPPGTPLANRCSKLSYRNTAGLKQVCEGARVNQNRRVVMVDYVTPERQLHRTAVFDVVGDYNSDHQSSLGSVRSLVLRNASGSKESVVTAIYQGDKRPVLVKLEGKLPNGWVVRAQDFHYVAHPETVLR
jgi:hypothetical protein